MPLLRENSIDNVKPLLDAADLIGQPIDASFQMCSIPGV